jgi:mRNA-degrading endonuclease RelE of RelBE toxin-antitoxin system
MAYRIEYSPDAEEHLQVLPVWQRKIILDGVDKQLYHHPTKQTKNRKPMRPNPLAPYELRFGNLRVYYDVTHHPEPVVLIRAIGIKEHNVLRIGGKVIQL